MAIQCPRCGRQYDVTLFEFQRAVRCDCGAALDLARGHMAPVEAASSLESDLDQEPSADDDAIARLVLSDPRGIPPITPATWDYITSRHIAEDYDRYYLYNDLFEFDTSVLERWLPRPGRLLDLGCGSGRHTVHFALRGFEVTAVDLSEHMLAVTRRKLMAHGASASLVEGDITRLDELGLGHFHYALCMFSTLGMVYGRENRLRVLKSARDHLDADGLFVFHVHNRWHNLWYPEGREYLLRAIWDRLRGRPEAFQKPMDGYRGIRGLSLYVFSAGEVRRMVARAGLRVEHFLYLNRERTGELRGLARGVRGNGFIVACRRG